MDIQPYSYYDKGPQRLLSGVSQSARGQTAVSGMSNCLKTAA
jgi:hypothetical protein